MNKTISELVKKELMDKPTLWDSMYKLEKKTFRERFFSWPWRPMKPYKVVKRSFEETKIIWPINGK